MKMALSEFALREKGNLWCLTHCDSVTFVIFSG